MALADFLALGNSAKGAYDAQMQAIVNAQNQQRINDMLANDALNRRIAQQKYQDYLSGTQGAGEYWRQLAQGAQQPAPMPSATAPAPAPGQNSAKQAAPQQVPIPGANSIAQFTPNGGFSNVTTPQQVQRGMELGVIPWQQGASIIKDMQARGAMGPQFAQGQQPGGAAMASAPAQTQQQQPLVEPKSVGVDLPMGDYGRVLALAQNNQVINLAARAASQLLHANPNMSDRQLDLTMQTLYPALSEQSKNMLQLAGLSNTQLFKSLYVMQRQQQINARYPGFSQGGSAYTPQQIATAADMLRNGQQIPMAMKPYVYAAYPDIAPQAMEGKAKQAAATVTATATPKAAAAVQTATATAPVKATSTALTQVDRTLSAIEPAYNALETNFSYLLQTAKQYGLGPATPVNAVLNKLRKIGSPDATRFQLALQAVQKEYGKVLTASTGARGVPVAAMREANDTLSPNMTLGQLEAAQQAMQTDGRNVLDSYRSQKAQLTQQLQGNAPAQAAKFQQGAVYTDANGNKARYDNGQWIPVK